MGRLLHLSTRFLHPELAGSCAPEYIISLLKAVHRVVPKISNLLKSCESYKQHALIEREGSTQVPHQSVLPSTFPPQLNQDQWQLCAQTDLARQGPRRQNQIFADRTRRDKAKR